MPRNLVHSDLGSALQSNIRDLTLPLTGPDDLDPLLERIGDSRFVLLGEASHGTSEFYTWRARISQRLIREKGFSFIAVEGDWPDCYRVNLWESLSDVMEHLEENEPAALDAAREAYQCFEPYGGDVQRYAQATAFIPRTCEAEVVALLSALRNRSEVGHESDHEARFNAEQNARAVVNAENYYRAMMRGGAESWNVRDHHMAATLNNLMEHHGPKAKAVVWEHNTHIGDDRATDMASAGMVNVGQLVRERHGSEGVVLVGFSSYQGSVIAGNAWGAQWERMHVPPAREGSWEQFLHGSGVRDALLNITDSTALHPLHIEPELAGEPPETYPWGV